MNKTDKKIEKILDNNFERIDWKSTFVFEELTNLINTELQKAVEDGVREFAHFRLGDASEEQHERANSDPVYS